MQKLNWKAKTVKPGEVAVYDREHNFQRLVTPAGHAIPRNPHRADTEQLYNYHQQRNSELLAKGGSLSW